MTQHTPGALQALGGVIREHLPSGETVIIATDVGNYASFVTAAELVRRWNTHEAMLEALRGCLELLEADESNDEWAREFAKPRADAARAALAAAEGPSDTQS